MYIESVINDYYERNDFEVSSFSFLCTMADDFRYKELMNELNEEINSDSEETSL
jgi:hypothetical protein